MFIQPMGACLDILGTVLERLENFYLFFVCQFFLSQGFFTKNDLFRKVRSYCGLKGSGLR
jgi:hypothetical protein